MTTAALRRWFIGDDLDWRAYGIATPVYVGEKSTLTARFTVASAAKTVTVDGSSSTASASTLTGWAWDFGDGATATGATATHSYTTAGAFTVVLTVTDDRNTTATSQQTVTISAPNAAFTWTASGPTATFDGSASVDPGSTIRAYGWDFGDGATGTGATTSHTYATGGTRTVILTVTSAAGVTDTDSQQVTVALPVSNPVAAFTSLVSNSVATFDASASTTTNATITGYAWTFGDGATGSGPKPTHSYATGTFTAALTITDSQGRTATVSHPVTVSAPVNQPPTAAFTATPTGLRVVFSAVTSTDGDGTIASYAWTYGDGGTGTGINPTHDYAAGGSFPVRLTVTDNLGAQASTSKTVTVTQPVVGTDYITSGSASTSSTLQPASNAAVLQQFLRSPDTGEFYSSQAHPESDGVTESTRISRMTVSGTLLDQMLLTGAGHGTSFALEFRSGVVWIWLNWQRTTVGGPVVDDLVRLPYIAGTFTRAQVTGLNVVSPGPSYRLPGFDWQNGYAVIRTSGSTSSTYRRHKLTDVLAGNLTAPVNTVTLPEGALGSGLPTLQGFATYAGGLFRYTGAPSDSPDRASNPPRLTEYDWATGAVVRTLDTSAFGGTAVKTEPEGLSVYDNGSNPVLFFGVTQGPTGGPHTYPTWWYPLVDTTVDPNGQPTGAGITRYQDLTSTAKFSTKVNSAGTGQMVSFPPGTFEFTNFSDGSQTVTLGASAFGANLTTKGILGSGQGKTILQMTAGSSNKAGDVPADGTGQTNNLEYVEVNAAPDGFLWDGLTLNGTAQGHFYNGLQCTRPAGKVTFSNATFKGVGPGDSGTPPGETFAFSLLHQDNAAGIANFTRCTFDGSQTQPNGSQKAVGAALLGTNTTSGTVNITDCVFTGNTASAAVAMWENKGTINITRSVIKPGSHRNLGGEAMGGTVNITDPLWADPVPGEDDIRITWTSNFNLSTYNVYFTAQANWDAFIAARTNKKILTLCTVKQAYGGSAGGAYTGTADIRNYCHVYIGGVKQTTSNFWTFTGQPVN